MNGENHASKYEPPVDRSPEAMQGVKYRSNVHAFSGNVGSSGIECTICMAGCSLLSGIPKQLCQAACAAVC